MNKRHIQKAQYISKSLYLVQCNCGASGLSKTKQLQCNETLANSPIAKHELMFKTYKKGAETRNLNWTLTETEFGELIKQDCHYCGSKPKKIKSYGCVANGIDRKNNDIGYAVYNCLPCCSTCNFMKRSYTYAKFTAKLREIHEFLQKQEIQQVNNAQQTSPWWSRRRHYMESPMRVW